MTESERAEIERMKPKSVENLLAMIPCRIAKAEREGMPDRVIGEYLRHLECLRDRAERLGIPIPVKAQSTISRELLLISLDLQELIELETGESRRPELKLVHVTHGAIPRRPGRPRKVKLSLISVNRLNGEGARLAG